MRGELDSTEILEDSLEAYFAGPARGGGLVYGSLLASLALGLALLPLVRVDVSARAAGMLRPAIERHRVSAGAGGVVERVAARLGEAVSAGQLLVALRRDAAAAGEAAADSAAAELRARAEDLRRLLRFARGLEGASAADRPAPPAGAGAQGAVLAADRAPPPHLARYREERERAAREWEGAAGEIGPAGVAAERAGALAARGLLAPAELEEARLRRARALAGARLVAARLRAAWGAELAEVEERLRDADAARVRLRAEARLAELRAPVAGTLEALAPLSPGSWVGAGEEVAVISPAAPLVAELLVDGREIGRVRRGVAVRLLVDAFDRHEWGTLPAVVAEVADDYSLVQERPAFRVRCALLATTLRRADGRRAVPRKGMSVTAAFVLGRVNLLHLLWDRVTDPLAAPAPAPATGATPSRR